jgi:hypothetical protein
MSIKYDDFKKLKQLDRIEYLLHRQRIGTIPVYPITVQVILYLAVAFGFFVLFDFHALELGLPILSLRYVLSIFSLGVLVAVLLDWLLLLIWAKRRNDLDKEYFQINITPKK